nr:cysteine-rich receptor-like protein kinase [Tanacetum cinerariifolium]
MSLDEISPLTFSIGNTMKRISVIVSSIIIFRTPVQPVNALGAAIAVFGTFLYSQEELECDVSKEELKWAVWDCGVDKSPGPDSFIFGFFCCNSSFIALIPKTPGANMVKDSRPISLIGCMYKIIAKILTNRFVGVIGDIVNEVQSAFIMDRQILDGLFILNEAMHWCTVKKNKL